MITSFEFDPTSLVTSSASSRGRRGKDAEGAIARLRASNDAGFQTLSFVVAGAYLMDTRVKDLLGYPGQEAKLVDPDDYMSYVESGLLNPRHQPRRDLSRPSLGHCV
ncbi:MAG: hypothetical protein KatS3mg082_2870 [Nitrospiraceae bacterium]|nr:MAG: hypothetical protein KatS3mg082_2870 [Nitrospiraceae bacterium]